MSGGGHDAHGSSGIGNFAWNTLLLCGAVVAIVFVGKFVYAEIKGIPLTFSSFQGVSNGGQNQAVPQTQSQAPAPITASPDQCPRVNDAKRVRNTMCRKDDIQLSWRGKSNYCLSPQPKPQSYPCHNTSTNMLAWYTP
jgi:hypothetical protein